MSVPWCAGRNRGQCGAGPMSVIPMSAIMVSRTDHALQEIPWRAQSGELHADIRMIISNHTAVGWHLEDRVIAHQNSTIVFS